MVWTWYVWRAVLVNSVEPHIGHNYIGAWQRYLAGIEGSLTVATRMSTTYTSAVVRRKCCIYTVHYINTIA